jgi:DNA repair exonuclease SbcCD ATPase subunit
MGGFMSLTETLMLVALGFALALLMVLLFGRGFWAIATSFGAARKVKNIPVQMLELQADRDRLRAEHAIMSRKLELRLEEIKGRMTAQMAEVSRSRNRVQTLVEQLESSEATVATRDREVAELMAQVQAYTSEIETTKDTLNTFTLDNDQKNREITKLTQSVLQLTTSLREANSLAANSVEDSKSRLRARTAAIAQPLKPEIQEADIVEGRMKKRISQLTSISMEMDETQQTGLQNSHKPVVETTPYESDQIEAELEYKFDDAEREADSLDEQLKAIDEALEQKRGSLYTPATPVKSSAKANIISLAQRIRSLQGEEK